MKEMRRLRGSQTQGGFESPSGLLEDVLRPPREVERTGRLREAQQRIAKSRIDRNACVENGLKIPNMGSALCAGPVDSS
jgi:hypothetical protein